MDSIFLPNKHFIFKMRPELENAQVQEKIANIVSIAEELLPGRGALMGEFVLF